MIFTNKVKIAKYLNKTRPTIDNMIEKGLIKCIKNDNGKKLGYVIVFDFIAYLVNNK